ncbi:MAG: hypothetical protein DIU75_015770 [Mycolicibacterium hassiacum]|nr:hypothetical protein [Mycolicibacterium hassiacum]MBX5489027.1 hypothetical protein [Mycolicibacterium hassiacum]
MLWLRPRVAAGVVGAVAAGAMVVVGCSTVTSGTAQVDQDAAPVYRASVSASIAASIASSSARESERQASLTRAAVQSSCETLSTTSVEAISKVNEYVDAYNNNSPGLGSKVDPAVDALNHSADAVSRSMSDALLPELRDAMNGWIDAARAVATAVAGRYGPDEFNPAVRRLNEAKTHALNLCDAAYRR